MIEFKLISPNAKAPVCVGLAAGIDLHTTGAIDINETTVSYGTGVAVDVKLGYVGILCLRSSLGTSGHMLANSVGIIDPDYRGEIIIKLDRQKHATAIKNIEPGDRIAQLVVTPCVTDFKIVNELTTTIRGNGGFGSTGVK